MTDVLKCVTCNIVIDEMLCYIQNNISVVDDVTMVRMCTSKFKSDEIKNSKTLLFDTTPTDVRKRIRKSKGKEDRDVIDIIHIFKSTEPDTIPVFVARQLDKLPPILMDHLDCSQLLKDISKLRTDIEIMKTKFATIDSLDELKAAVFRIQNDSLPPPTSAFKINKKRGAWCDSGPMGLSHDFNMTVNDSHNNNEITPPLPQYREMKVAQEKQTELVLNGRQRTSSTGSGRADAGAGCGAGGDSSPPPALPSPAPARSVSSSPSHETGLVASAEVTSLATSHTHGAGPLTAIDKGSCSREVKENNNEGWQTVQRRKVTKYRYSGKAGVARDLECTFRAAERRIPMFITNVHMSTAESDIVNHILSKTQESVFLEKINMKYERGHKAYKFLISETNLSKYMDETLWPTGVIFRRFVSHKQRYGKSNHYRDKDGINKPKHG